MLKSPITKYSDQYRLDILKYTQAGNTMKVSSMLDANPSLIDAKTKSTDSGLLHIASERGHLELCTVLIDKYNHPTNPIDKNGHTPYKRAKNEEIKAFISQKHLNCLVSKYCTFVTQKLRSTPFIRSFNSNVSLLTRAEMEQHPIAMPNGHTFGVTSLMQHCPGEHNLVMYFREDILMIPYYGEMLVIHENEQAIQFIEALNKSKKGFTGDEKIPKYEFNRFEARSFLKGITEIFKIHPFLTGIPTEDDNPIVSHVKKMIIAFAIPGFAGYYKQCSSKQLEMLQSMEQFSTTLKYMNSILKDKERVLSYLEEVSPLYCTGKDPELTDGMSKMHI